MGEEEEGGEAICLSGEKASPLPSEFGEEEEEGGGRGEGR